LPAHPPSSSHTSSPCPPRPQVQSVNRPAQFYSVLIRSVKGKGGQPTIEEVYRVKLPGNPILGEGTCSGT
jgi:hypothetical protein